MQIKFAIFTIRIYYHIGKRLFCSEKINKNGVKMTTEKQHGPEWFSIKEAAQYLSIGEPTLYRWMRDGKITYRKVGDSTRFLNEDLDAFIQVFPSKREAEKVKQVCPVCHHDDIVTGKFRSTGLNYFRPKKSKFWSMRDSNIKTMAVMCQKCGAITHFGDSAKLEKLVARAKAAEEAFEAEQAMNPQLEKQTKKAKKSKKCKIRKA